MVRLQVLSGLLYGHGRGDQPYCIFYEDVVTLLSDNRIKDHTKEVLPGGERRSGFLCDTAKAFTLTELVAFGAIVRDTKTLCEGIRVPE